MGKGSFDAVIREHLELQRRNQRLEPTMPIVRYREDVAVGPPAAERRPQAPPPAAETEPSRLRAAPWDDPDSWWNVRDPAFDWGS